MALPVGLVDVAHAEHPQFAAEGEVGFDGLGDKQLGGVVAVAEGGGFFAAVINLPVGLLGVACPEVGMGAEQVFGDFGFQRDLHLGFNAFLLGVNRVDGYTARGGAGGVVGRAAIPCGQDVHGFVFADAEYAVFVVFVEVVLLRQGGIDFAGAGFGKDDLRALRGFAGGVALGDVYAFGFGLVGGGVGAVVAGEAGGGVADGNAGLGIADGDGGGVGGQQGDFVLRFGLGKRGEADYGEQECFFHLFTGH